MSARGASNGPTLACLGAALVVAGVLLGAGISRGHDPTETPAAPPGGERHGDKGHAHGEPHRYDHAGHGDQHIHAPVPPEYRSAHVPSAAWTDPRMIARGKELYLARCALCHGESGDGNGPAGLALPLKPPDLRDKKMMSDMAGNYWFWRVSEGGLVEPFRSMGSAMPAWKDELSDEDRWAVIAYQHTFSGHEGPHVVSEHAELGKHAGHADPSSPGHKP